MKYKVVGKRGDIPFTVSSEEIADAMENHCVSGRFDFWNICMIKRAVRSSGSKASLI